MVQKHHLKMQLGQAERWNHIASTHEIGAFRPSPYATKGWLLPGEKIILPIWAANTCIPISNTRPSPKTTIAAPMQQKKARDIPAHSFNKSLLLIKVSGVRISDGSPGEPTNNVCVVCGLLLNMPFLIKLP
uniref:hypothetical protein n=1 Tax=Candidatus Fimivicinus sp. TaxID=3056640 RepID=UPI003FEE2BDC